MRDFIAGIAKPIAELMRDFAELMRAFADALLNLLDVGDVKAATRRARLRRIAPIDITRASPRRRLVVRASIPLRGAKRLELRLAFQFRRLDSLAFNLTDQDGEPIDLQGSDFNATLRISWPDPVPPAMGSAGAEAEDAFGLRDVKYVS